MNQILDHKKEEETYNCIDCKIIDELFKVDFPKRK